jgi:hypothetical protein
MKKISFLIVFALLVVACNLDVDPAGGSIAGNQKDALSRVDPDKLQSDINGLYSGLIQSFAIDNWSPDNHFDFGYPAACMMFDASGIDMTSENSGYNWFRDQLLFSDRTATSVSTYFLWELFYSHIKTANDILTVIDSTTTDPTFRAFRGQALASRAFDYLNLASIYQQTYVGSEQSLSVPIVPANASRQQLDNNPRATLSALYEQIIADLTDAIALLDEFNRQGRKEYIDRNVAYGLRARAYLNIGSWNEAAADAAEAIKGYAPYSIQEVSMPAFNDIASSSWIWGCDIGENNDVVKTGIVNFPSHICSFTGNGYSPAYAGRYINSALWEQIAADDVRKGWWLDTTLYSPLVDTTWRITYNGKLYNAADWFDFQAPYLNVKFGPYRNEYNNSTNACDFPLMRVEEMILIRAEALAMGGKLAEGRQELEDFVRTYRHPGFASTATTAEDFQDEVWFQRRIELWGEGFSLFDLKRLKKPFDRSKTNFPAASAFQLPPEAPILLWLIPESEINANRGIQENNPVIPVPVPVS